MAANCVQGLKRIILVLILVVGSVGLATAEDVKVGILAQSNPDVAVVARRVERMIIAELEEVPGLFVFDAENPPYDYDSIPLPPVVLLVVDVVELDPGRYMVIGIAHPNAETVIDYGVLGQHYWIIERDLEEAAKTITAWFDLYSDDLR